MNLYLSPRDLMVWPDIKYTRRAECFDDLHSEITKHFGENNVISTRKEFIEYVSKEETKSYPNSTFISEIQKDNDTYEFYSMSLDGMEYEG